MSKNQQQSKGAALQLQRAQYEVTQARKRFANTAGALQYRLKPATLVSTAWEGVRGKSSEVADEAFHAVNDMADGAAQAVRGRPVAASGVAAAIVIFLARAPLWRAATRIFSRGAEDKGIVTTKLDEHDENYELTAPTVGKSFTEGVSA
jgi:hypothetical protein